MGSAIEERIWTAIFRKRPLAISYTQKSGKELFYSRKVNAFLQILDFVPEVRDGEGNLRPPSEFKELRFRSSEEVAAVLCCFNSTLFRWFMDVVSDGSHVNRREVDNFPFEPYQAIEDFPELVDIAEQLSLSLKQSSEYRVMRYRHDTLEIQCIFPKYSKTIIDGIDRVLARYYDLTKEELDFIVNYDIKYRIGEDLFEDEEEDE